MQLIFQNSKQLKQVRQFIKSLNYVYDSSKDKQIYLYLCPNYIAIVNNYMNTNIQDYRICFCKFKSHMYRLNGFNNMDDPGLLYKLDVDLMMQLLNSQMEPDTTQLTLSFPLPQQNRYQTLEMYMKHNFDGDFGQFRLNTALEDSPWPFDIERGVITGQCLPNPSQTMKLLTFPPKFVSNIENAKPYVQFWLTLQPDSISVKKADNNYVQLDLLFKKQKYGNFGSYDFTSLQPFLQSKTNILFKRQRLFHHLNLSNKENKQTQAEIIITFDQDYQQKFIKNSYIYLVTKTQKKEIHQLFQVSLQRDFLLREPARILQPSRPRFRDTKKQQEQQQQRWFINKFYGPEYEETVRMDMVRREGLIKRIQPKIDASSNPRKLKVQF